MSSGHPLAGVEIRIVGERIAVKAPALLSGYLGVARAAVDADGWFITSDRGAFGPQGELYVLGRSDSVIVTGGENVDPEEVERALRVLPEVQDACVFGLPSVEFGQRVVAVVVPAAAATTLELEHLTDQLRSQLARFKLPRAVVIADALPFTRPGTATFAAVRSMVVPRIVPPTVKPAGNFDYLVTVPYRQQERLHE